LTDHPKSPYAASKKAAELLCHTYHYLHGLDVSILRYFTVYGPAGRPDMSIFRFIRWIAEGEPLVLYGDGSQERDFTFVEDIAEGTVAALNPLGFEVINLGSDHPVTIRKVIEDVEALLEKKAKIEQQPAHSADVAATWADNTKARNLLLWKPKTPFHEGLKRSVDWYQENRDWARKITV
jgi:nucleoside-diphosphate-sugar epimerase